MAPEMAYPLLPRRWKSLNHPHSPRISELSLSCSTADKCNYDMQAQGLSTYTLSVKPVSTRDASAALRKRRVHEEATGNLAGTGNTPALSLREVNYMIRPVEVRLGSLAFASRTATCWRKDSSKFLVRAVSMQHTRRALKKLSSVLSHSKGLSNRCVLS